MANLAQPAQDGGNHEVADGDDRGLTDTDLFTMHEPKKVNIAPLRGSRMPS